MTIKIATKIHYNDLFSKCKVRLDKIITSKTLGNAYFYFKLSAD